MAPVPLRVVSLLIWQLIPELSEGVPCACVRAGEILQVHWTQERASSGWQSFYTILIAVLICKPINIMSCHKFIKIFQISRVVNSGTCHISELHKLAAHQDNQDFLVCVLSVLVLLCCGAKVKKRVSSFTIICISALQLFEKLLHYNFCYRFFVPS